jgi:hypothetical protein
VCVVELAQRSLTGSRRVSERTHELHVRPQERHDRNRRERGHLIRSAGRHHLNPRRIEPESEATPRKGGMKVSDFQRQYSQWALWYRSYASSPSTIDTTIGTRTSETIRRFAVRRQRRARRAQSAADRERRLRRREQVEAL